MVPIGKFVGMTLWHYVENVRPQAANGDIDELFLSRDGSPITTNTIKLVFSRLAKRSGVERLHAHLCRHTFAINYLLNGGDIFSLREILVTLPPKTRPVIMRVFRLKKEKEDSTWGVRNTLTSRL